LERTNQILIKEKNENDKNYYEIQNELNMIKNIVNEREKNLESKINEEYDEPDTEKINEELQQLRNLVKTRNEECDEIIKKYNMLKEENKILNNNLKDMEFELEKNRFVPSSDYKKIELYEKIDKLKKENKIILNKKKYYKEQCKLSNDIFEVIKRKLTKEQLKEIENDKSFKQLINMKSSGDKLENFNIFISNKNSSLNDNSYSDINNKKQISKNMNYNNKENNIMNNNNNFENENNKNNIYSNNNIIFNEKFNSNINNILDNIDNKNNKEKNNNEDDIPEEITFNESTQK
jgi:hypothetical protein